MEEDSDVDGDMDNSLVDLHHGLDSSTEDNIVDGGIGGGNQDVYVGNGSPPVKLPAQHVNMLEDMVQEMRQGLQAAVEELAKLQIREDGERDRQMQKQQQRQLDDLTENVNDLKNQMNSMTKCLETIHRENSKLRDDYTLLAKYIKDPKGEDTNHLSDHSFEWNGKLPENPFDGEREEEEEEEVVTYRDVSTKDNDDEVTAVACKSLSLTQALGEKCLHLNLSMSSDEGDGEEPEMRRLSHFPTSTSTNNNNGDAHQDNESGRRHSLPASTTPRGSTADHIARAGQRRKAVKELTDSECDYCSQLWTLIETYCSSLQSAGFLSHDQLEVLFPPYLEKLYEQHCVIYSNLQDKLVHWSYLTVVSDLLSCITDTHNPYSLMSLYREYSENLPDAVSCLRSALAHSTELKALLKTIQQSSYQNEDLMTLIKAPAQHLPKYLLQLQQICKYTPSTHPDYLLLRTSLSRLRLFVEQMNIGINNAIHTASRDFRPGSSNDSSQVLSARDSGNISNEDDLLSARTMFKSEQCLLSEEMQDDPYHLGVHNNHGPASGSFYGRPSRGGVPRLKSSNLNTLSHPDLSRINNSPVPGPAPFSLPPSGLGHGGWRIGVEGRQPMKNKMRRMPMQPVQHFAHPDPTHLMPTGRPASAIDFTNGYSNVYPVQHYPGASYPRPRSAMGPLDANHRPAIISRKHMRRSQPPLSSSGYWADVDSHPSKHSQQRMSFSPHELLPSRPSPLLPYNSHEDDEEDDTRASDSLSCQTSSSHRQSSGRGSNNGHDIDLDFQPLASDPCPFRPNGRKQFSEDDVAVRLAQELLSEDDDDHKELNNVEINDGSHNKRILQAAENRSYRHQKVSESKSNSNTNESDNKILIPKQQSSRTKNEHKRDHHHHNNQLSNSNESGGFENLASENGNNTTTKNLKSFIPQGDLHEEHSTKDSRVYKQNGDRTERAATEDQPYYEEDDKRLKNQHFLLSLTHSPRSKKGSEPQSQQTEKSHRNSPHNHSPQSGSPVPLTNDKASTKLFPHDNTAVPQKSQPKVVRRSAPALISHAQNGSHPLPHDQQRARVSSPSQPSNSSFAVDTDNSVTSGVSSTNCLHMPSPSATQTAEAASAERRSSNSRRHVNVDPKNLMTRSIDLSETTFDNKESMQDRKGKSMKNGAVDSLPRASDDPVNARKKMHLKSSIKNLFSKKRGKVFLADVEREVILEMASAVVSSSTSPSCVRSNQCYPVTKSPQVETNQKFESSPMAAPNQAKEKNQQEDENRAIQRIPEAFEIKCKKDKMNSTESPLKVWRSVSYTQSSSDNLPKSFHRLSLNPATLPQSPCSYQDNLLKERLNIHDNPELEHKSLIHPKFLVPAKSLKEKDGASPVTATIQSSYGATVTDNVPTIACISRETPSTLPKERLANEVVQCEGMKGNLCKNGNKYEESEKKQIKAKMKAYAHMKKHILNYESQEADMKDKDDGVKRSPDKNNAKPTKHKVECPKCQNKSPDVWKYPDQTPGKSFHIQAYKAYKSKNKETSNVDKQEADILHNKDLNLGHQNKIIPDTVAGQGAMHVLKPCEEAIALLETSRNPKMTSSYPMALQERKVKKSYQVTEPVHAIATNTHTQIDGKKCKAKEKSLRENILSLSSGVFYEGDCYKPQIHYTTTDKNNTSTNDLSHPAGATLSYNVVSLSKPNCFNLPASSPASNIVPTSSNDLNKRHSFDSTSCVSNIFKMSKDELFEYERNRSHLKDPKGKSLSKKLIAKPTSSKDKECVFVDGPKPSRLDGPEVTKHKKQSQFLPHDMSKDEKDVDTYFMKEERDYFDYTYRLCYVDCNKFDGDFSTCVNCSSKDNCVENKSFPNHFRNGEMANNLVDMNMLSKGNPRVSCSAQVDKRLEIETKSCSEINKWLANLNNNSASLFNKDSILPSKQPKDKSVCSSQSKSYLTQKSDSSSFASLPVSSSLVSASGNVRSVDGSFPTPPSQSNPGNCALHPEGIHRPTEVNRYNCRNSTLETFSPSLSQPIFSVLPIEGYHVDSSQLSSKYGGITLQESQSTSLADPNHLKSQDDAIARRALKQRVKSKEAARLSSCSIQSGNEIHILKLHNFGDVQHSAEPENPVKYVKESSSHHKNTNTGSLQVRYVPKQFSPSKQNKIQTTAHAQIKRDPVCLNVTAPSPPNHLQRCSTSSPQQNGAPTHHQSGVLRCSPSSPQQNGAGACPVGQSSHAHNGGMSASGVSGPDLLQVSVVHPGAPNKSDTPDQATSSPPKKQSFFSRFAHSPLSIFYKDAKNNGSK